MEYNIYCDESCHLKHDGIELMGIGGIWCPKNKVKQISDWIRFLKMKHKISPTIEIKWTKVTPAKLGFYLDLIDYFFSNNDLHFRMIIINKNKLKHKQYHQTHDDFYYKMYFEMLSYIFEKNNSYNIFLDIKDTKSYRKCLKLRDVCSNSQWDFEHEMIKKIQPIRSEESQILQLADVLIGAIIYNNRIFPTDHVNSLAKEKIIQRIKKISGYKLNGTNYLTERKINLFFWEGR